MFGNYLVRKRERLVIIIMLVIVFASSSMYKCHFLLMSCNFKLWHFLVILTSGGGGTYFMLVFYSSVLQESNAMSHLIDSLVRYEAYLSLSDDSPMFQECNTALTINWWLISCE